ncbi:MAG: ABC transporter ATP-binding protein [Actinobacteria bacterium]|nr:ABC transporter ATP-binding protein [Actinomycetota bacterium]
MNNEVILEVEGLTKRFGGVTAVDDVSVTLNRHDILGVIGPNGSGKTTFVNLITGFVKPTKGTIRYEGHDITGKSPHVIADRGIARTFQVMRPYPTLAAYKNLIVPLSSPRVKRMVGGSLGDRDAVAIDILEEVGFERDAYVPYKMASSLPLGYLKRLELARCLALRPDLIICDEVFSGLSMAEIATMVPVMERLHEAGLTIIMIEHRLRELFRLANRVIVLNFGRKIADGAPADVMEMEEVKAAYMGTEVVSC